MSKQLNIDNVKRNDFFKDVFDIRSFIILFAVFSLVSIWSANMVYNNTRKITSLNKEVQNLKAEYVSTKTILMTKSKRSYLLKKAEFFGLYESKNPLKIIYLENEY